MSEATAKCWRCSQASAVIFSLQRSEIMPTFDARSETNIKTLVPKAQEKAREFLQKVRDAGINARIIGGTRTFAEQDALFALGRTKPGKIVTNARGGFSNHNFGVAWDIGIFEGTKFLGESKLYDKAGEIGKSIGLQWGGDFNSIIDKPHFQCKTGKTLAQLRALIKAGTPVPVLD
jgi:peptidoglycan LD-endopeptidase CwlK